jgi:predicted adenine nucleotide alpha hydrolase (AANH) superfamily ATPase
MKANGFTKQRMQDAVNYLVDNFRYKQINIADVITYDKRVRLYTHQEYCSAVYHNKNVSEDFTVYGQIDGITFWYRKSELAKLKSGGK